MSISGAGKINGGGRGNGREMVVVLSRIYNLFCAVMAYNIVNAKYARDVAARDRARLTLR